MSNEIVSDAKAAAAKTTDGDEKTKDIPADSQGRPLMWEGHPLVYDIGLNDVEKAIQSRQSWLTVVQNYKELTFYAKPATKETTESLKELTQTFRDAGECVIRYYSTLEQFQTKVVKTKHLDDLSKATIVANAAFAKVQDLLRQIKEIGGDNLRIDVSPKPIVSEDWFEIKCDVDYSIVHVCVDSSPTLVSAINQFSIPAHISN